jgi:hypothetical protein
MRPLLGAMLVIAGACEGGLVMAVEVDRPPEPECSFRSCIGLDPRPDALDILFVVGDGPTMTAASERLRAAMPAFAAALGEARRPLELRIGFTGVSVTHPGCAGGGGGGLRLPARCGITGDWIEWTTGVVDADVDGLANALQCAATTESDGCAFQSPLRATDLVIQRSIDHGQDGFFRQHAGALIVIVTDAFDCSVGPNPAAFDSAGERALWSDPEAFAPTPAVCWRAGASCWTAETEQSTFCEPVERDERGELTSAPDEATLQPIDSTADLLSSLFRYKAELGASGSQLLLVAGVPSAFALGDSLPVAADADPEPLAQWGVGPGCDANGIVARPPVRALEVLDAVALDDHAEVGVASICAAEQAVLVEAAVRAVDSASPACLPFCVADEDPDVLGLQPDCQFQYFDGERRLLLPRCGEPLGDAPACVELHTDDALHPTCNEQGWNLEVQFHWSEPIPQRASVLPDCIFSDDRERDCPNLP